MNKIFIVEDNPQITESVTSFLQKWNFEVKAAKNFQYVVDAACAYQPDLILLDISLPMYNGFYWCTELRKHTDVPIVFLSSASDNMTIVMAMNMGADDFIAKPFDLQVLVAKIQAILRRSDGVTVNTCFQYNKFTLDLERFEVKNGQTTVPLTINETKILGLLFQQPGTVISKEKMMETLWESEAFIDSNTLAVNMTRLRKKLATIGLDEAIYTQKGKGYRLGEGV